jgi:hypothetical protein
MPDKHEPKQNIILAVLPVAEYEHLSPILTGHDAARRSYSRVRR